MQLLEPFNPYDHNPEQGEGQLPVGKHPVIINGAEVKATKNNDGGMIVLMLQIIDGPLKGATGPYRLNLYNKSEQAVKIARSQLSALCYVTQRFQLGQNGTDLSPLFNVPFIIEVVPQAANENYTEIKKVFDINGNEPKAQGGGQSQQPAQQNGGFVQQQQPQNNAGNFAQNTQPAHTVTTPANTAAWGGGNASVAQPEQQQQAPQGNAWGGGAPANNGGGFGGAGGGKPAWAK